LLSFIDDLWSIYDMSRNTFADLINGMNK